MHHFEVYKDKSGGFRFRFKASNGETMFSSESYSAKASALKSIKERAAGAEVKDTTIETRVA